MTNRYCGMRCVIHRGADFSSTVRAFQDKRASLLMGRLSAYAGWQLKIIQQGLELRAG